MTLGLASSSWGQSLELGGSIATAARGSEGALVASPWYPGPGVYGTITWFERFETTLRVVWVQLGSREGTSLYYRGCESGVRDCRSPVAFSIVTQSSAPWTFVTGSASYSFRADTRVRPFVGLGLGVSRDSRDVMCRPAAATCDGVAGVIPHFHRPGGEGSSLFETALGVGYRF